MEFRQLHSANRQQLFFPGAALIAVGRALQDSHGEVFAAKARSTVQLNGSRQAGALQPTVFGARWGAKCCGSRVQRPLASLGKRECDPRTANQNVVGKPADALSLTFLAIPGRPDVACVPHESAKKRNPPKSGFRS
jgi:hypothetical protein